MMAWKTYPLILFAAGFLLNACSNVRHLPPNEKLYTGATVKVEGPDLTSRQKKVLKKDLQGLTRPKPNSTILGMRVKLGFYNMFRKKKPDSFLGRWRDRWGEPPVLLSQFDLQKNIQLLQNHLENKGFFRAVVTGDTIIKKKRAKAEFLAQTGAQYKINKVFFPSDSTDLSQNISISTGSTLLLPGEPFDLDLIKGERIRIDGFLKERGFYFFSPEYLLVKTDSSIGHNLVDMYVTVKPDMPRTAGQIYRINDVFIYSDYSLNTAQEDTNKLHIQNYMGYNIIDKEKKFKPFLLKSTMQFEPGEIYNRTEHNQTLNRIIHLNVFKFVKNRFEVVPDSAKLDVYYYLTPLPSKTIKAEITTINRSNNLNGSELSLNWKHRNLFRGGQQLNFKAYVGSDVQFSGSFKGYNTYRTGAEIGYVMPHIVVPFRIIDVKSGFAPRTTIRLGYDILQRQDLYTLNSYRLEYGYTYKRNLEKTTDINPVSINYVQAINVTDEFRQLMHQDTILAKTIQSQFILGSNFQYNFNEVVNGIQKLNNFYFNGIADVSGNIAGLLTGANYKDGKEKELFGAPFAQYFKIEADGRYYRRIGVNSSWANRVLVGVGIPYGNSIELPYIKQFFVGGNNSLRGFRSRGVGPGTYHPVNLGILPDQTGDIKLEMNTEFRPKISGPFYGAVFIDAGNIWLFNDSTYTRRSGGKFTGKFLNQLALDAGVGLRLDITIFVIRFDIGFPLRKPWEQNPWVLDQFKLNERAWRQQNIVYNLAIGYPF